MDRWMKAYVRAGSKDPCMRQLVREHYRQWLRISGIGRDRCLARVCMFALVLTAALVAAQIWIG